MMTMPKTIDLAALRAEAAAESDVSEWAACVVDLLDRLEPVGFVFPDGVVHEHKNHGYRTDRPDALRWAHEGCQPVYRLGGEVTDDK